MFTLTDTTTGETLLMRDGEPFRYTSRALAQTGRSYLEKKNRVTYTVTRG
jgi:hypothetical protein